MNNLSKIVFLLLFSTTVFAQGVCDITTGIEKGGFTFETPSTVCIGQEVKIKDNSGGTEVKYIFGYQGEDASKLAGLNPTTDTKWTFLAAGQYVILQYGKKNGKEMYYCNLVTVRKDNQPKFSYNSCGDNFLTIIIPKDISNNFDYYEIDWGDGKSVEKVTTLPFKNYRNYSTSTPTRNIRIEGFYNSPNSCTRVTAQTVPMRQGGNFVSITQVQLTDDQKEAIITLKGSDDEYDFYQRGRGDSFKVGKPDLKTLPGVFKIKLIDTVQTCFTAIRNSGCTEIAGEVCTVKLESVNALGKDNIIKWNPHPLNIINNVIGVDGIVNSTITTLIKQEKDKPTQRILVTSSPYVDKIDCSKEYCYQIEVKVSGVLRNLNNFAYSSISLSSKQCINRQNVTPSPITDAFVTVNNANNSEMKINDNSPWTLNRKRYILYRDNGTEFTKIDSIATIQLFTDKMVDASQKSYCYKVSFVDECGRTSETSPPFCTTNLSETSNGFLQWTNQSPFGNSIIKSFEIQSFDNTGLVSTEATQITTTYEPKLDKFEEEAKYRIKAIAPDGKESFSNVYTIPLKINVFVPNAFSPNEDGINDDLTLKGSFKRFTIFQIEIYNRWGIPVFTSDDVTNTWDGKYQNTTAPNDTYTYKIYAKLKDGQEFNKSGKLLLLR